MAGLQATVVARKAGRQDTRRFRLVAPAETHLAERPASGVLAEGGVESPLSTADTPRPWGEGENPEVARANRTLAVGEQVRRLRGESRQGGQGVGAGPARARRGGLLPRVLPDRLPRHRGAGPQARL